MGKGPGVVGSLLGKGVRNQREISLPSPSAMEEFPEGARLGIMGQRPGEKSEGWKGVDLSFLVLFLASNCPLLSCVASEVVQVV